MMILYNGWGKPFAVGAWQGKNFFTTSSYEWIIPGTHEAFE